VTHALLINTCRSCSLLPRQGSACAQCEGRIRQGVPSKLFCRFLDRVEVCQIKLQENALSTGFRLQLLDRSFILLLTATRKVHLCVPVEQCLEIIEVTKGICSLLILVDAPSRSLFRCLFIGQSIEVSLSSAESEIQHTPVLAPVTMITFPVRSGISLGSKVGAGGKPSARLRPTILRNSIGYGLWMVD